MDNLNYKTCPLKRATGDDVLVFHNVEINDEDMKALAEERQNRGRLSLLVKTKDGIGYVGPAIGHCDRECCGWWNEQKKQCSIVTLSNNE